MPPKYPCAGDRIDFNLSLAPGTITVTATAPNSAETRTVVQWIALDFPSQAYQVRQMRVVAIHRFTADLALTLEAAPGWYALATHFVSMETGQHTARVEYEPFEVTT